jgi:hypothetical protein
MRLIAAGGRSTHGSDEDSDGCVSIERLVMRLTAPVLLHGIDDLLLEEWIADESAVHPPPWQAAH